MSDKIELKEKLAFVDMNIRGAWDEMTPDSIYPSNKTISLMRIQTPIVEPYDQTLESGDTYFYEAIDEPKFGKRLNGRINVDNLGELD